MMRVELFPCLMVAETALTFTKYHFLNLLPIEFRFSSFLQLLFLFALVCHGIFFNQTCMFYWGKPLLLVLRSVGEIQVRQ